MRMRINWKRTLLKLLAFIIVIWADNALLDVAFMILILWDLINWARTNPSVRELIGFQDISKMEEGAPHHHVDSSSN